MSIFMVSLLIPLLITGYIAYRLAINQMEEMVLKSAEMETTRIRENFESTLESLRKDLTLFLETSPLWNHRKVEFHLKAFASSFENFLTRMILTDERGKYILLFERRFGQSGPRIFILEREDSLSIPDNLKKATYTSIKPDVGGFTLRLISPWELPGNKHYVIVDLKLPSLFEKSIKNFDTSQGRSASLLDSSGVVIYNTDWSKMGKRIPFIDETVRKNSGYFTVTQPVNIAGLYISTTFPLSPSLLPLKKAGYLTLLFVFLIFGLTAFFILRFINKFTETVKMLALQAGKIATGGIPPGFSIERRDELGEIALHLKEISEELYRTAQLKTLHKITAFISHDLKNQVAQLSLLLRNLEKHFDNPSFKEDAIFTMKKTVENMEELIRKLKSEGRAMERRDLNIREIVLSVLDGFPLDKLNIKLRFDIPPLKIKGDRKQLETLFINLFKNSIEAMPKGGMLEVDGEILENKLKIRVRDSGLGIPDEIMPKIFEPFTTTKEDGLGLGLYQVREIVENMGGKIEIFSEEGKGTEVIVTFPLNEV
jgi:signal transduction histidine kinase